MDNGYGDGDYGYGNGDNNYDAKKFMTNRSDPIHNVYYTWVRYRDFL